MKTLPAITLCLLCLTAHAAENELRPTASVVDGGGGHRIDFDTTGKPSLMADSLFTNCVLWLPFSYDDGVNAYDLSASANDSAATNANTMPAWGSGVGGAVTFDGVDDYIDVADDASLDFERTDAFSILLWANLVDGGGDEFVVSKEDDTANRPGYVVFTSNSRGDSCNFELRGDTAGTTRSVIYGNADVVDGTWHHLSCIKAAGTGGVNELSVYVDGIKDVSNVLDNDLGANTILNNHALNIGARHAPVAGSAFADGTEDDVRIYNRALTSNEQYTIAQDTAATYYPFFPKDDFRLADYLDLALWLPFDADEGTNFTDKSSQGNDGASTNANTTPTWSTNGVTFDGVDDYINVPDDNSLDFGTGAFALSAWINPVTFSGQHKTIFCKLNPENANQWSFQILGTGSNNGELSLRVEASNVIIGNTALSSNVWQHVVCTRTGTNVYAYVNGILWDSGTSSANLTSAEVLRLGFRGTGYNGAFDGTIDDQRIYNRALTSNEQFTIYNDTKGTYGL